MSIRAKTKRRVVILLATSVVVSGLLGGAFFWRRNVIHKDNLQRRAEGMAAFDKKNYDIALTNLGQYLGRENPKDDVIALFAYAKSRAMIDVENVRYQREARDAFKKLLDLPNGRGNVDAQRELIEIYDRGDYDSEIVSLADEILKSHPDDKIATKHKAKALLQLNRATDAFPIALRATELDPDDIDAHYVAISASRVLNHSNEQVLQRAAEYQKKYPENPRAAVVMGLAYFYANDGANGTKWFRTAVEKPAGDSRYVKSLAKLLNQAGMYEDCQKLLQNAANIGDPQIEQMLVQMLWQNDRHADLQKRTESVDLKTGDSFLLAIKALSLYQQDQRDAATKIVDALASRGESDGTAAAWTIALRARYAKPELAPQALIDQIKLARSRNPRNGIFVMFLADAYDKLGETELAMRFWRQAAEFLPGYVRPHLLLSSALLKTNRYDEAYAEARLANQLAPSRVDAFVAVIRTWAAKLQVKPDPKAEPELLKSVALLQKQFPNEPSTLPIYASLLVNANRREEAVAVIQGSLSANLPNETLHRLLLLNTSAKLGLAESINQKLNSDSANAQSPDALYRKAITLAQQGKPMEGVALLESAAKENRPEQITYKLALLTFKERIPGAANLADWVALGNENASNVNVQKIILREAGVAWSDEKFISATIDRLKALTGEEGIDWKLAQARLLLGRSADDKSQKADAVDASILLNDVLRSSPQLVDARLLLTRSLLIQNNPTAAIDQLRKAMELRPDEPSIAFELVRLLRANGRANETMAILDKLTNSNVLSADGRKQIAQMISDAGLTPRAIEVLNAHPEDESDPARNTLLAQLYRKSGRFEDAKKVYAKILTAPTIDAPAIASAVEFYTAARNREAAEPFLARLNELKLPAGAKETILANSFDRLGDTAQAEAALKKAIELSPRQFLYYQNLVSFHVKRGQYDAAISAIDSAQKELPGESSLTRIRQQIEGIKSSAASSDLKPLIDALAADPRNDAISAALSILQEARQAGTANEQVLIRLGQLSDQYPLSLPIQMLTARGYLSIGRYDDARALTTRALSVFPAESEPARLQYTILSAMGDWSSAKVAADQWRDRTLEQPQSADLARAEAQLQLKDFNGAFTTLAPYSDSIKADPAGNPKGALVLAQAMIMTNRAPQAVQLVSPILNQDPSIRLQALHLANLHGSATTVSNWIDALAPLVGSDASAQEALAGAWYDAAIQYEQQKFLLRAAELLKPIVADPKASASAWAQMASIREQTGDYPAAELGYREVLKRAPGAPMALNNLAYLLLLKGSDLDEALKLSNQAIKSPNAPATFHDTLARIYARQGKNDLALKSFSTAVQMAPNNVEAMIGLADVQNALGHHKQARESMMRIELLLKTSPRLSPVLQQQLDQLRKSITATAG